ncbi:O-antigen ligase family protein [Winogradskyella sp. MH6]|uniref:O-antigen ligase family protein n=1 Tax=Winogradskyella sp. MH6 TaxID=2929510 RepID=UPI001FB37C79|nr:O-antigen ligase family protein [Winogradskyella sp. MH6]
MGIAKSKKGLVLILFFTLLSFLDLLYPSKGDNVDRIVPQIGRAAFFGTMLVFVVSNLIKGYRIPQSIVGKAVKYLLFLFTILSLLHLSLVLDNITSVIKILYWITGFYFFYQALISGVIKTKHIEYFTIAAVLIYFLVVLRDYTNRNLWEGSKDFFVSNNAYHLLKFFPLVLLFQNKLKNVLILLIAIGIVLAFKRGALLAFGLSFVIYYLYILFKEKKGKLKKLILGIAIVAAGAYYFIQNISVFLSRSEDLESVDSAGSGRGQMFRLIAEDMILDNFQPLKFIFGNGVYASKEFFQKTIGHKIVAHSDVLEFFFDFGLIGLVILILFYYRVYKLYRFFRKEYYGMVLKIWLVASGLSSLYSINLFAAEMIYAILPIVLLELERLKRLRNHNTNTLKH